MKSFNPIRGCIYLPGDVNLNDFDFTPLPGLPAFRAETGKPQTRRRDSAESGARATAQLKGRVKKFRRPSPKFKGRKHGR